MEKSKVVFLVIKKECLGKILYGKKRIEYREIKPFNISRLEKHLGQEIVLKLQLGYNTKEKHLFRAIVKKSLLLNMYKICIIEVLGRQT